MVGMLRGVGSGGMSKSSRLARLWRCGVAATVALPTPLGVWRVRSARAETATAAAAAVVLREAQLLGELRSKFVVLPESRDRLGAGAALDVRDGERSPRGRELLAPRWSNMVMFGTAEKVLKVLTIVSSGPAASSPPSFSSCCSGPGVVVVTTEASASSPFSITLTSSSNTSMACLSPSFSRRASSRLRWRSCCGLARGVSSTLILTGNRRGDGLL